MVESIRRRITYANVVSTLALFLALSAGAYALSRNSVKSKHIAPGAVKVSDTATSLRLKCPGGTRFLEGACIERTSRPTATFSDAENTCIGAGRRLPSPSEGAAMTYEPGFTIATNGEWVHGRIQYQLDTAGGGGGLSTQDSSSTTTARSPGRSSTRRSGPRWASAASRHRCAERPRARRGPSLGRGRLASRPAWSGKS